jgi:glycosyltransferase involved in cell wall biosynthesis
MTKISVAIPTWSYGGHGAEVLAYSFGQLKSQRLKEFEVVISDDSEDGSIERLCETWSDSLNIKYYKNQFKKGPASNSNHVISKCTTEIIKYISQDDFLIGEDALGIIVENFDDNTYWAFTEYAHTKDRKEFYRWFVPQWHPNIRLVNMLGTPSGLTIRNLPNLPKFDERLKYHYDSCYYWEMYHLFGEPKIIPFITMINYIWNESITSSFTSKEYYDEVKYIQEKYA